VSVASAIKPPEGMRFSASPPELAYVLLGPPVPWQRARSNRRTGAHFTDPRMKLAQNEHRWMAAIVLRCAVRAGLDWDDEDRDARYELEVIAHCAPTSRGDSDNYGKLVADALQRVLYPNDRQLVRVIGERRVTRELPRTSVRIRRLP
jgi:Holliday junction resolvase RusA-like endonuclease